MLRKVQDKWTGVELPVKQYKEAKDAYILGSVEEVQTVLEDSLATMATICSSRFVAGVLRYPLQRKSQAKRSLCSPSSVTPVCDFQGNTHNNICLLNRDNPSLFQNGVSKIRCKYDRTELAYQQLGMCLLE